MGAVDEIIAGLPIDQLAAQLGVDPDTTEQAVREAVPALFSGLQANVADPQGAMGLAEALTEHADVDPDGGVDLEAIDVEDGAKIVQHIFGAAPDQVQTLGGVGGSLMSKLLPILAPIVMSYIAKRLGVGSSKSSGSAAGGLGDLLGPILGSVLGGAVGGALGGGSQSQAQAPAGGGDIFGQILGQVLGGGSQATQPSQGGSGDILGQILGQVLGGGGAAADTSSPVTDGAGPFQQYPGAPKAGEPQMDLNDTQDTQAAQQEQQGGLGGLLGQIFGR